MAELLSSSAYDTLKHQVQQLKLEQQSIAGQRAKNKEVCIWQPGSSSSSPLPNISGCQHSALLLLQFETAALLQQKLQYEEQLYSARQEASSLQQRLKENVERAGRVRQHAERCVCVPVVAATGPALQHCCCNSTLTRTPPPTSSCTNREQRALSQQVERLQQSLASVQGEHEQQLAAAQAAHLQQLQDIRAELEARQQQWVRCTCILSQSAHASQVALC
jgi:hypothetical protein